MDNKKIWHSKSKTTDSSHSTLRFETTTIRLQRLSSKQSSRKKTRKDKTRLLESFPKKLKMSKERNRQILSQKTEKTQRIRQLWWRRKSECFAVYNSTKVRMIESNFWFVVKVSFNAKSYQFYDQAFSKIFQ